MKNQDRIAYVQATAALVAKRIYNGLPYEDRAVFAVEDLASELVLHVLAKESKYSTQYTFRPWVRSVIYNRGRTLTTRIWDARRSRYPGSAPVCGVTLQSTGEDDGPELVLVDMITPVEHLIFEQEVLAMAAKLKISVAEARELCERFDLEFSEDNVIDSIAAVLEYTLSEDGISEEDFANLPQELRERLEAIGDAYDAETLQVVAGKAKGKSKAKAAGGEGRGRRSPDGPVARIRDAFKEGKGITEVPEMIAELTKLGVEFSEATVRTQVGRLRKEYGLVSARTKGGGTGIIAAIHKNFERGIHTTAEMAEALAADPAIGPDGYSMATVRTQVGKLRKEAGLTDRPPAPAAKPAATKKAAGKKKAAAKKADPAPPAKKAAAKKRAASKKKAAA